MNCFRARVVKCIVTKLHLTCAHFSNYLILFPLWLLSGINQAESTHIVTSQELLPKVVKALPKMQSITHIIYIENHVAKNGPERVQAINLVSWTQLQDAGKNADPELKVGK